MNQNKQITYDEETEFFENLVIFVKNKYNIDENVSRNLVFRYGLVAVSLLENGLKKKSNIFVKNDILKSEIEYSIEHEMAILPNDFICRRTGIAFVDFKLAENLVPSISAEFGKNFRWSRSKIEEESKNSIKNLKYLL